MNTEMKIRWPLAFLIITVVAIISAVLIYNFRDNLGSIPMRAVSDSSGGAIIAWQEEQGIFVQHIDASGEPLWKEGGLPVSEVGGSKPDPYAPPKTTFTLIADGLGGAIITWDDKSGRPTDFNDPAYFDPISFYTQRISASGKLLWENTRIASENTSLYGGEFPIVIPDGTGGAIFAWNDDKTYFRGLHDDFLRLHKLAPDGTRLWGNEGKLLVTSSPYRPLTEEEISAGIKGTITRSRPTYAGTQYIVSDGAGGCIAIWEEEGDQSYNQIYAQRLDTDGNAVWDKVPVGSGNYLYGSLDSDGTGGAVLAFSYGDNRMSLQQHIGSNGELLATESYSPSQVSDGSDGSIRVWIEDEPAYGPPNEKSNTLRVQRFNAARGPLWSEKQVLATPERYQIGELDYIGDGQGGLILLWRMEKESVSYGGLFAQKVDAEGDLKWGEKGIPVFNNPDGYQGNATVLSDGSRGILIIVDAGRNSLGGDMVYAQHLDADGNRLWGDGVRIDQ